MFAQVKDMKCVSSKCPLPIIAEQDGSVAELNTFSNCQGGISNFSKDRASFQPGSVNSDVINEYTQPQGSDSTTIKTITKGKRRNTSKKSATPSSKSQQNHAPKQSTTASSSKSHQKHASKQSSSKSPENFHKPALSASNSGKPHRNPHDVGETVAVLESSPMVSSNSKDLHSYKDANLDQRMKYPTLTSSSESDNKQVLEHLCLETDSAFTKLISNEGLNSNVDSQTTAPLERCDECRGNAVETDEALRHARLSISLPSSQFVAPAADIAPESWTQVADLTTMHDMDNPTEQYVPQITITAAEESQYQTSKASPPTPDSDDDGKCEISPLIHSISIFGHPSTNRTWGHASGKRPKPNAHLTPECSAPPFEHERKEGNHCASPNPEHSSAVHLSDFWRLKETTEKLHLSTRRPSTMLWRKQYMEDQGLPVVGWGQSGDAKDEGFTTDRRQRIDEALEWLRNELLEMRSQDQNLARQLLTIRQDIHHLKLQRSTEEHRELLEDFQCELDDIQEFSDVLDLPKHMYGNNPLKHVGVTRLNISARRFSAC